MADKYIFRAIFFVSLIINFNILDAQQINKTEIENSSGDLFSQPSLRPENLKTKAQSNEPLLVILAKFPDTDMNTFAKTTQEEWNRVFFGPKPSVRDYFEKMSQSKLILSPASQKNIYNKTGVCGWYTLPKIYSAYKSADPTLANAIADVLYSSEKDIEYSKFDTSPPFGYISTDELHIFILFAAFVEQIDPSPPSSEPTVCMYHVAPMGIEIEVGGVKLVNGEKGGGLSVGAEMIYTFQSNFRNVVGFLAHEIGHDLGLSDHYTNNQPLTADLWCLMGTGCTPSTFNTIVDWNYPNYLCAAHLAQLGWYNPTTISTDGFYNISEVPNHGTIYKLWENGNPNHEYFLVENRNKQPLHNYDHLLPSSGLLIWHVDSALIKVNDPKGIALEEADDNNKIGDAGDPFSQAGNAHFLPYHSTPNSMSNSGDITGVAVYNISAPGAVMTADIKVSHVPNHINCTSSTNSIPDNGNSTATVVAYLLDTWSDTVESASNLVTFSITAGAGSGQLVGTNPVSAVNGVAKITLQSTTTPGLVTIEASSPGLTSGSTIVNVYNNPTEVGGHINKDTTWPLTGSPYVVTSDLAIDAGVILTIEPGVTIKFNRDRDMSIYGALVANGTASAPIAFTANATNPYPRYWGGIKFYDSGLKNVSILNFCSISYGGQGGYGNFDRPLILNGYANPTITNTTMSNNNRNGIDLETGTYSSDINLNITTLPYIIRGDISISSGATMILQPGVLIKLESDSDINIYGSLKARGTATQHIIFTSVRDDAHSGDSNGDGVTAGTPGDWGGIFFDHSIIDANTILDYCEIYYAGQGGYGNHDCPLELHALANPTITNTYLANNKFNGIDLRTGSYSSDILLNITNQPYMIRGDLVVESSATLTISPAVIIKFGNECDFYIRGALKAQGNNSDHIIFTSLQDDFHGGDTNANGTSVGSKGNWGGIRLYDSIIDNTTVMDYCEVMYGGCGGYGNNESPIVLDGRANPRITNSLLLNNSRNAIDLITGDYSSDFKLDILNFPYLIRGDLVIKSPAKLTILPGVILKFSSECDFYIDGSFSAVGTSSMPIIFTSIKDDSIGGDSNGDGASVGTPGDWGGIGFRDASDDNLCLLDNVKIFYAGCGGYGNYAAPLAFDNASPKIQRVTIANSRSHGAICYNAASPDFGGGIQASQGQNKFYDFKNKSSKYALYNDGSADIYARNNYWDTNDSLQIEKLIYDKIDHSSKGRVYFYPYNSAADMLSPQVTVISPNGGENWIIGSKQTITWSAIDNDGISKIYFFLSRDAGVTFSKFDSLSSNPGVLNWMVPAPYSNNCKIKIQALDFSGNMGFDVSNGNFAIVDTSGMINHPPTSPTVLLPINGEEARPDDYLVWAKSTDPDVGDAITYTLELDNNANFSSPEIRQSGISGDKMNNEMALDKLVEDIKIELANAVYIQIKSLQNFNNLKDDSTYYWRVKAVDNYRAESNFTSGTSHFFFNKTNTAPQAVVAGFSPKDGIEVRTNKPEISWHPAKDADLSDHAGTLRYKLQLDDDGEFSSNYKYQYTTAMGLNTFEVPDPLSENVRWYYRVQTVDDEGLTSPWSAVQNFWVNAIDEAPRPFVLYRPANNSTVTADSITFAWASANDVDPNDKFSFTLEYSTSSSFLENVVSVPNLTDSSIAIDMKGMAKTAYYWRVKAVDSDGLVTWGSNSGAAPWQFQFNPTSVMAPETNIPKEFSLSQNHPNPFNPETIIEYQLPISCHVAIIIYNTLGQEIRTLIHGEQQAGYHQIVWDGRDNSGQKVGTGIYLYQMRAGEFGALKKMVLIQ